MVRCPTCHRRLSGTAPCPVDGWAQDSGADVPGASDADATPAPEVPGHAAVAPLGAGGFSVVWSAARDDGAEVAIKVARSSASDMLERFRREAAAMELIGPPHVPRLLATGRLAGGAPYLVMERLSGCTLAEAITDRLAPPDPGWVEAVADGTLVALEAAHARGVVHRDIKPENLFLAEGGRFALLDFGLVKRPEAGPALTRPGAVLGTLEYMAPEQLRGDPVDAQADVYAIGALLFELFTLRPPFIGDARAVELGHLALRPPRPSAVAPVPAPVEAVLLSCLAKDPAQRPRGASGVRSALRGAFTEARAARAAAGAPAPEPEAPSPSEPGARLLAAGQLPVAIAVLDSPDVVGALAAARAWGGVIARQRGERLVLVFSASDTDHPARAALEAAQALPLERGARAALHLAPATLRRRPRGAPLVLGAAVEHLEQWMPAEPWSGLWRSEAFERAAPAVDPLAPTEEAPRPARSTAPPPRSAPASADAADRALAGASGEPPLVGRDDELRALAESARVALERGAPALVTLIGDHGLGKSALVAAAAAIARRARPGALVITLRGGAAGTTEPGALARALCDALGEEEPAPSEAVDRALPIRALAGILQRRAARGPVAVIVDDAHRADDAVIDALEYATLDGEGCPLWVVLAAHPRLEQARPDLGRRTRHITRVPLSPLGEPAATRLAAALLRPAEYPPAAVLERLARWSAGVPAGLVELTRTLKQAGLVRRRGTGGGHYIATADLEALPPSPAWQWMAQRRLGALPPELAACARACAALGAALSREALGWVLEGLEREGRAGTPVDAGYGLDALVAEGLLRRAAGDRYAFREALLEEAIEGMLDAGERAAIHRHALAYWRRRAEAGPEEVEVLEALARHAAGAGEMAEAAEARVRLGDQALARNRHVDADQQYTAALAAAPAGGARLRVRALAGRGKSRVHLNRGAEAAEDLAEAQGLAAALGDERLTAELLLEEATALDWAQDLEASARRAEEARLLVEKLGDRSLQIRQRVAAGRTLWRRERPTESIEVLTAVLAEAEPATEYESRVIALLMLSFQLAVVGRLDEAEERFEEVIALASAAEDTLHLSAAYSNRLPLWDARRDIPRAMADLRLAIAFARELGNGRSEAYCVSNGAALLHRAGEVDEALALARRACLLEQRFLDRPRSMGSLLLARILLVRGELIEARSVVERLIQSAPHDLQGSEAAGPMRTVYGMLRLVLAELAPGASALPPVEGGWDAIVSLGTRTAPGTLLEVLHWRARLALDGGRPTEAAEALRRARACPDQGGAIWRRRIEELEARLAASAEPDRPPPSTRQAPGGASGL